MAGSAVVLLLATQASAQVVTIDKEGRAVNGSQGATVDRRFAQIVPTHVKLSDRPLDPRTKTELIRLMQAEQGFAMRPFPRGHKGLTLEANGKLTPAGEDYLNMVTTAGLSAKPGDRLVITDLKFEHNSIIFMLNDGPDAKHRFLRHIQIGTGSVMNPVVQDSGQEPAGARLTLNFSHRIPELTGSEVKALLAPLISFDVKTPIEAYTDTLPPELKKAILNHHVMVGMTTDMVMFALGQPDSKQREIEGQMPFEEWIYGVPPKPVQFVRINGNRVIRVEIAKVGEEPQIFTKDEVTALMRTDGTPLAPEQHTRTIAMGDTTRNPDTQAAAAPPSLRKQGEQLPQDTDKTLGAGAMKPVQFPKQQSDDYPDATNLPRTRSTDDADAGKANPQKNDGQKQTAAKTSTQDPAPAAPPEHSSDPQ